MTNYPWDVLSIEATDDKKVIKKAYAKLIRTYRPDEAPEKFQELNQAYQYALGLIKQGVVEEDAPSVNHDYPSQRIEELSDDKQHEVGASIEITGETVDQAEDPAEYTDPNGATTENDEADNPELDVANNMLEQFHQMAFSDFNHKKDLRNWAFIDQYHDIQDLQLRDSLSKELFKRVAEYNFFQLKENKTLLLNQPIVKHVAGTLEWESQWQEFHQEYPAEYVQHVFGLLEVGEQKKEGDNFYNRTFGLFLEIIMTVIFVGMIYKPSFGIDKEPVIILAYIVFNSFSSLSKISLSSMQHMLDYKLMDVYMNKPSLKAKAIRTLIFHVSMIPLYLTVFNLKDNISLMFPIAFSILMINILLWLKNKQFLHDWLSGTIMIK